MANLGRNVIVYGNDTVLYVHMKKYDKETHEYIPFDITKATDLTAELTCSKHATHIPIPFEISEEDTSILVCSIDYRLLHTNAAYGLIIQGYDENEDHFRFEMLPSELLLVISNTSGLKVTEDVETIDILARVGWGINKYVNADWDEDDPTEAGYIKNKPDLSNYVEADELSTVATTGDYNDLENKPVIPAAQIQSDWNEQDTESMAYIQNKPTIPSAQVNSDWNSSSGVSEILNKPDLSIYATTTDLEGKQDSLVSGTNIKTINNQSLLGSGNIDIQGGGTQVQSDWDESDSSAVDYIKNKPYVPYDEFGNILVQGYTGSNTITGNILSGSNTISGETYNSIIAGAGNTIGARQSSNFNFNQNIMLGWQCSVDNVHTSLILGENCDINTPASGALIIGQNNIVYNTSWPEDTRNKEPIFILGKGNKMGYNTNASGWNIANKYMIGNYLTCEGDRDPGLYVGQYNKYLYYDQNNDPVYYPYDDALLTVGNGQLGVHLNALLLDEHNQLYIQPYNSSTNNDNIYEDVDGMINVAKKLANLTPYDYSKDYFTIVSLADNNTISWKTNDSSYNKDISISTDNGSTWTQYTSSVSGTVIATLNTDDKVLIKGSNTSYGTASYYCNINTSNTCKVEGNIMSLIYGDNFKRQTSLTETYTFRNLFDSNTFTSAENLVLPATTLTDYCYYRMFFGKSNLQIPPKELPAITLSASSYEEMFANCSSLTIAPVIKATVGANSCCKKMFMMCSSLTKAPDLLFDDMMYKMGGFVSMFEDCTSLNYVKCLASLTSIVAEMNWLLGVSATGTFIKNDNTSWSRGASGIPTGWNVYNASQDVPAMKYDIPAAPVQSDWNESDNTSLSYIQNKPDLSTKQDTLVSGTNIKTINNESILGSGNIVISGGDKPYEEQYLTFEAIQSGTFTFTGTTPSGQSTNELQYSIDNGSTWTTLTSGTASPTIAVKNKILWKATGLTPTSSGIGTFSSTGNFKAYGNVMSLYYGDNFIGQTSLSGKNNAFSELFQNTYKLKDAANVILPATTLSLSCYVAMFRRSGLVIAPKLPATTLQSWCYSQMFQACESLTTAPELPATTLTERCYNNMFSGCSSLTIAPKLPATTLANNCYNWMFQNCTSLTTAPELPATTLANSCYANMFYGCTNLNYVKCLATNISASSCTSGWLTNVAATGTFITANSAPAWTRDASGIPSGWNAYTESQYELVHRYELPAAPVQSDWNESNSSSLAYIQNKPTIPDTTYMVTGATGGVADSGYVIDVVSALPQSPLNNHIYIIV